MKIVIDIPEEKIPKQQGAIEIPLLFVDGEVCQAGGYEFDVLTEVESEVEDDTKRKG